jgi:hypothetical protein
VTLRDALASALRFTGPVEDYQTDAQCRVAYSYYAAAVLSALPFRAALTEGIHAADCKANRLYCDGQRCEDIVARMLGEPEGET